MTFFLYCSTISLVQVQDNIGFYCNISLTRMCLLKCNHVIILSRSLKLARNVGPCLIESLSRSGPSCSKHHKLNELVKRSTC